MVTLTGLTLYLVGISCKIFLARHLTPTLPCNFPVHFLQGLIHFNSICCKQNPSATTKWQMRMWRGPVIQLSTRKWHRKPHQRQVTSTFAEVPENCMCYWAWKGTFSFPSLLDNWRLNNVNQNTIKPPFLCLRDVANSSLLLDCRIPALPCATGIQLKWSSVWFQMEKKLRWEIHGERRY